MILEEAYQISRTKGAEKITVRAVSKRLGCSIQPVLYHFATMNEVEAVVYQRAHEYHTQRFLNLEHDCKTQCSTYDEKNLASLWNRVFMGVVYTVTGSN